LKTKIISFILLISVLSTIIPCAVSAAAVNDMVSPAWSNTGMVSCMIGFPDDGYGYAEAHVMGHPTANKIHADVYVYRQVGSSWVYVGETHKTVESCSLSISCKFTPIDGAYYRADYTFVVTKDGVDETISQTKYKTA
jgi:hypothetical protein